MDYEEFQRKVSQRIKDLRLKHNLTQEEIAGLEMGVRVYQRIESGGGAPSLKSLFLIAKSLKMHPKELLDFPVQFEE